VILDAEPVEHGETAEEFRHSEARSERRHAARKAGNGPTQKLESEESKQNCDMQRIDPPGPEHDEPRIIQARHKPATVAMGDHEAGQDKEVVDKQIGAAHERTLGDRSRRGKVHHRHQKRADATPRIQRLEA
jgi:hypothetical protein